MNNIDSIKKLSQHLLLLFVCPLAFASSSVEAKPKAPGWLQGAWKLMPNGEKVDESALKKPVGDVLGMDRLFFIEFARHAEALRINNDTIMFDFGYDNGRPNKINMRFNFQVEESNEKEVKISFVDSPKSTLHGFQDEKPILNPTKVTQHWKFVRDAAAKKMTLDVFPDSSVVFSFERYSTDSGLDVKWINPVITKDQKFDPPSDWLTNDEFKKQSWWRAFYSDIHPEDYELSEYKKFSAKDDMKAQNMTPSEFKTIIADTKKWRNEEGNGTKIARVVYITDGASDYVVVREAVLLSKAPEEVYGESIAIFKKEKSGWVYGSLSLGPSAVPLMRLLEPEDFK